jgi:hypothetical protein
MREMLSTNPNGPVSARTNSLINKLKKGPVDKSKVTPEAVEKLEVKPEAAEKPRIVEKVAENPKLTPKRRASIIIVKRPPVSIHFFNFNFNSIDEDSI